MSDGTHKFGGAWTDHKLQILSEYLIQYTTALSKQAFVKTYIDAFAGTGYREHSETGKTVDDTEVPQSRFEDFDDPGTEEATQLFLDGSARVALHCSPPFDQYIFIEKKTERCHALEALKIDFPDMAQRISIEPGDANQVIQKMCGEDWLNRRAVLFLDPYGTQVRWKTIEAIAGTRAIDLWILFPIGPVNRMLTQSGDIPPAWKHCLDELLGTQDWYDTFYRTEKTPGLFGDTNSIIKADIDVIQKYFVGRLRSIFEGVAPNPAILRNSKNSPLYLLCFAAANPKGAKIALRIASHILAKWGS